MRTNKKTTIFTGHNIRGILIITCWIMRKKIEYLIDIDDVTNNVNNEDGCLHIETLLSLESINEILTHVWKEKPYISDSFLNLLNGAKKTLGQLFTTN